MKKPNITPGAWKYHLGRGKTPRFHVQTSAGYQVASTPELKTPRTVTRAAEFEENAAMEANAKAIAAVPDILAALEDCIQSLERMPETEGAYKHTCISQARAALTKAGYTF